MTAVSLSKCRLSPARGQPWGRGWEGRTRRTLSGYFQGLHAASPPTGHFPIPGLLRAGTSLPYPGPGGLAHCRRSLCGEPVYRPVDSLGPVPPSCRDNQVLVLKM